MDEFETATPEPLERDEPVATALSRIADGAYTKGGTDEEDDDVTIDFRVAGGAPGQRFKLALTTSARAVTACTFDDDVSRRHRVADGGSKHSELVASLAQQLTRSQLLSTRVVSPMFLPDTVIGTITISAGGMTRTVRFAADPDQAAVQGLTTPPEVLAAADALYDTAGRVLDMENVRP
jgi:hypothetical protein